MKIRKLITAIVIVLIVAGLFYGLRLKMRERARMQVMREEGEYPVNVILAEKVEVTDTLDLPGSVSAVQEVKLSSKVPGRIARIYAEEGSFVRKGQVLIELERKEFLDQVNQAKALVDSANIRYQQAQTAYDLQKSQVQSSIQQAEATLAAAQQNLLMLKSGARPQEIKQAESMLAQAEANLRNAEANFQRTQTLYNQGAVSKQAYDLAKMQYDVAKAQVESAKQQLELVKLGPREEQIRIAEQNVRQAEAMLQMAKDSQRQVEIRKQDVEAAKTALEQARASYNLALINLRNTTIVSPINGYVVSKLTDVGEVVAPGIPLLVLVDISTLYVDCVASEMDIASLKAGQYVDILFDALPGRVFHQRIETIIPAGDPQSRSFKVRISMAGNPLLLKPGMFARARVIRGKKTTFLLPRYCVYTQGEKTYISVVENDKAVKREVKVGESKGDFVEILAGLNEGEKVIERGDTIPEGSKVRITKTTPLSSLPQIPAS